MVLIIFFFWISDSIRKHSSSAFYSLQISTFLMRQDSIQLSENKFWIQRDSNTLRGTIDADLKVMFAIVRYASSSSTLKYCGIFFPVILLHMKGRWTFTWFIPNRISHLTPFAAFDCYQFQTKESPNLMSPKYKICFDISDGKPFVILN